MSTFAGSTAELGFETSPSVPMHTLEVAQNKSGDLWLREFGMFVHHILANTLASHVLMVCLTYKRKKKMSQNKSVGSRAKKRGS